MEKELKDALITIAEYDGWVEVKESANGNIPLHYEKGHDWMDTIQDFKYHTSADSLRPVWRKVGEKIESSYELTRMDTFYAGSDEYESHHENTGKLILNGDYPAACIKLAKIIKQLR